MNSILAGLCNACVRDSGFYASAVRLFIPREELRPHSLGSMFGLSHLIQEGNDACRARRSSIRFSAKDAVRKDLEVVNCRIRIP